MSNVVYGTAQTLNPTTNSELGPLGGLSRSNTVSLQNQFPAGVIAFERPSLIDVKSYYYQLYRNNMAPSPVVGGPPGISGEMGHISPSLGGMYNLRYGVIPVEPGAAMNIAPYAANVPVGAGGLPGTAYVPNTISAPGANPANMGDPPASLVDLPANSYGQGVMVWPNVSSEQQSINCNAEGEAPELQLGKISLYRSGRL